MANVLFFAIQSLTEFRVFSTPLDMHLYNQPWGSLSVSMATARLAERATTLDAFRPIFDRAVVVNANR